MKIELGKEYKTRDGKRVRIYAIDGASPKSIHGAFYVQINDSSIYVWNQCSWYPNGKFMLTGFGAMDIVSEWNVIPIGSLCAFWNEDDNCLTVGILTSISKRTTKSLPRKLIDEHWCGDLDYSFEFCEPFDMNNIPPSFDCNALHQSHLQAISE